MQVEKRDGSKREFDISKIINAITKADEDNMTDEDLAKVTSIILNKCKKITDLTVEKIQDIVEDTLMKNHYYKTAKSYILYRDNRTRIRENKSKLLKEVAQKIYGTKIDNQNANVDEKSFGGRKGEASNELMKEFALNNCMSKKSRENHLNNRIYIHDLDNYALGNHNCLSIPFDDLLKNGFNTRQTDVRPASSLNTAFQLVAVIFQLQSLQQFGGVAATHLDWTMVPYFRKSLFKHYLLEHLKNSEEFYNLDLDNFSEDELEDWVSNSKEKYLEEFNLVEDDFYIGSTKLDKILYKKALFETRKELTQAVEGMYHNLNTLQSRSGNQLPFTSINYGTCTLKEGQLVNEALLRGSIKGVGKVHKTAIFPCGIWQYMKGVNDKPGTPNYYLYKLALESTSKRLYPNYCNVDWSNNVGYDVNDPKTYNATMGALAGHEHLYIKIGDEQPIDLSIKDLFNYCQTGDLENYKTSQIYFNKQPLNEEALGKQFQEKSGLPNLPGVYSITYLPEDVTYIGSSSSISRRCAEHKSAIGKKGGIDAGLYFGDVDTSHYEFKVIELSEDYKELENKYIQLHANINPRGISKKYYKLITQKDNHRIYERPNFKQDYSISQQLLDLSEYDIKVLDRDNKWVKIKHIFKNDKKNSPFMLHIYYKEYDKEYCLSCTEDHPLWIGDKFLRADKLKVGDTIYRADNLPLTITDICWHWEAVDSYDIGTETGSFIGSDIIMHNCRTWNGADINAEPGTNPQTKDGRGNLAPVTIILPTLAMEANRDVEEFMKLLDKALFEAKDMLIERYEYMCAQDADSAKFMYENNVMMGYHPEEGIRSALKHGTLVIGQLGLAETLELLVGCNHTKPEGMQLAKRIEQLYKDRCAQFKQEWHYLKSAPSKDEIKETMIKNAESKLGRKLTEEEKNTILNYKK